MSDDCLERVKRGEKMHMLGDYQTKFSERVERLVCEVCKIEMSDLRSTSRKHKFSHPRAIVFSILWQPYGFRSLPWLARRYKYKDHTSVLNGIKRVENLTKLKNLQTTIIEILVTRLEIEMFGSRSPAP